MNQCQFIDLASHICLAGAVVASWSLTQQMEGLNLFTVKTNINVTESDRNFTAKCITLL